MKTFTPGFKKETTPSSASKIPDQILLQTLHPLYLAHHEVLKHAEFEVLKSENRNRLS